MNASQVLERTYPVSDLSQGKAARILASVQDDSPAFIFKNNAPYRVVVTPADYAAIERARAIVQLAEANAWADGLEWESETEREDHVALRMRLGAMADGAPLSGDDLAEAAMRLAASAPELVEGSFRG